MNLLQLGFFSLFVFSVLVSGICFYSFLSRNYRTNHNGYLYLGEALLLGSILVIGQLLILSLLGLYRKYFLWGIVLANFLLLLNKNTRKSLLQLITKDIKFHAAGIIFLVLCLTLFLRNFYFLIDVDSLSTYLFTQKVWLTAGKSLVGSPLQDVRIFAPQFDALPYSLGMSLFGKETLFAELVNIFWRMTALLLVFGYTSYRFNRYYGLAATMFILFNDHFFYSGVNQCVLINGAVIAFIFAATYNFWEARRTDNAFRYLLGLIFLSQFLANKYQMAYFLVFLLVTGTMIQPYPVNRIKQILRDKRWVIGLSISLIMMCLWFFKNYLVTKDLFFPAFAGRFGAFGWTVSQEQTFLKIFGGITPAKFFKYMSYLFIWPGVNPAKVVILTILLFPIILGTAEMVSKEKYKSLFFELCFWLGICILAVMGICLLCHQDPRYYRYPLGLFAFTAVISLRFILTFCFKIRKEALVATLVLFCSLAGFKIIFENSGPYKIPTLAENIGVLFNRINMDYAINKHHPEIAAILDKLAQDKDKTKNLAWGVGPYVNLSEFLLPIKPKIALWYTTLVKWDSYKNSGLILKDLKSQGIEWVMKVDNSGFSLESAEDYAIELAKLDPYRNKTYFDYGFPAELTEVKY